MANGPFGDLFKQARKVQEQVQDRMDKVQQELSNLKVNGESGAGLVTVLMNGRHDVNKVTIDPSLLTEDITVLEDLIAAAVNDAVRKVEEENKSSLAGMASQVPMPDGFGFGK
ncbi:MAG: YbaB/EbfC family nucleoid-associated protein [Gammaproteobacteria bacterium]|nr:MAG: YbaB/EbfC family nucleoid-associated protein [Gammaproteobacteria bacterium]